MSNIPILRIDSSVMLEDNGQWKNRFEIHSSSSDRVYVIAQNKKKGHFGCSCPGYKRYRKCKHLNALNLPQFEIPYTGQIQKV